MDELGIVFAGEESVGFRAVKAESFFRVSLMEKLRGHVVLLDLSDSDRLEIGLRTDFRIGS